MALSNTSLKPMYINCSKTESKYFLEAKSVLLASEAEGREPAMQTILHAPTQSLQKWLKVNTQCRDFPMSEAYFKQKKKKKCKNQYETSKPTNHFSVTASLGCRKGKTPKIPFLGVKSQFLILARRGQFISQALIKHQDLVLSVSS